MGCDGFCQAISSIWNMLKVAAKVGEYFNVTPYRLLYFTCHPICYLRAFASQDQRLEIRTHTMWSVLPFPISHVPYKGVNRLQQAHSQRSSFHKIPMLSVSSLKNIKKPLDSLARSQMV